MNQMKQSIITKIERQKKDPRRMSLFVDEQFVVGVDSEVVLKLDLAVNLPWNDELQNQVEEEESYRQGLKKAFDLLYRSSKTRKQLGQKLIERDYSGNVVGRILEKLSDEGFLNDLLFSEQFIETRSKKYGAYRMRQELRLKGVADSVIDEALENVEQDSEFNRAFEIGKKRVRQYASDPKEKIYNKLVAYLSRKGFSYDVVKKVVKGIIAD